MAIKKFLHKKIACVVLCLLNIASLLHGAAQSIAMQSTFTYNHPTLGQLTITRRTAPFDSHNPQSGELVIKNQSSLLLGQLCFIPADRAHLVDLQPSNKLFQILGNNLTSFNQHFYLYNFVIDHPYRNKKLAPLLFSALRNVLHHNPPIFLAAEPSYPRPGVIFEHDPNIYNEQLERLLFLYNSFGITPQRSITIPSEGNHGKNGILCMGHIAAGLPALTPSSRLPIQLPVPNPHQQPSLPKKRLHEF